MMLARLELRCWARQVRASSSGPPRKYAASTLALHADSNSSQRRYDHGRDVAPPIGTTTTFEYAEDGHVYSRDSTPTRSRCEDVLSALCGGKAALFGSGNAATVGAISALAMCTPHRRRTVKLSGGYHGTHQAVHALRSQVDIAELGPPGTLQAGDVAWIETPKNPTGELVDIAAYCRAAALLEDCDVIVDSTMAPPPLQDGLAMGARVVVHSATKGLAGHSDALLGVVVVDDEVLAKAVVEHRLAAGAVGGSLETWLLLRSLRTLELRVLRATATALYLAENLRVDPLIAEVHHAGETALAERQMPNGVGAVFAIELTSEEAAKALPHHLLLFKAATSLGGVESLAEWRRKYDDSVSPTLVRLSIGLEDQEDLLRDIQTALRTIDQIQS